MTETIYHLVKKCSKCRVEKTLECFNKHKGCKFGVNSECKKCFNKRTRNWYLKNREQKLEQNRKWKEENKEYYNAKSREWYENNKEQRLQKCKEWQQNNRDKTRAYCSKWLKNNREKRNKYQRDRKANNSDVKAASIVRDHLRRVLELTGSDKNDKTFNILGYSLEDFKNKIEMQFTDSMCWDKVGPEIHIDHKIPVDYFIKKGETRPHIINSLANLQPLWGSDNYSKSNKYPLDFEG